MKPYTITAADVGKPVIRAEGHRPAVITADLCGRILPCDVGKRIYFLRDVTGRPSPCLESTEQFKERTARE